MHHVSSLHELSYRSLQDICPFHKTSYICVRTSISKRGRMRAMPDASDGVQAADRRGHFRKIQRIGLFQRITGKNPKIIRRSNYSECLRHCV